jgi:hypothetical protein
MTRRKAVAIDANLLVLFIVGTTSAEYITKHKRCAVFEQGDFELLVAVLLEAAETIVTPNTLTEASNLLRQIGEPARTEVCLVFQAYIRNATERYVESHQATNRTEFIRLGLADAALLEIQKDDVVILTTDLDLYLSACRDGRSALNFFHLKQARA